MTAESMCEKIGWMPAEALVYATNPTTGMEYPVEDLIVVEGKVVILTKEVVNANSNKANAGSNQTTTKGRSNSTNGAK